MTSEQALVLALLRALAQPTPDRLDDVHRLSNAADLERVLAILAGQRIVTRLGGRLLDDPEVPMPGPLADTAHEARRVTRHRGMLNHALTGQLVQKLESGGVPVVPLKGAALAAAVYGDVGARESSDIDLLVRPEDLEESVHLIGGLGWTEPEWAREIDGLPRLHRELTHERLPPLELHWRVHWYEESFAAAALSRATLSDEGWRRPQPADELAFLLLFLARDGFAGLRQTVDVAAWWLACGGGSDIAAGVRSVADAHPELAPALTAAARYVEEVAAIPRGSLAGGDAGLSRRQRAALGLANPWFAGSREQIAAELSLVDGLLTPARGLPAFFERHFLLPRWVLVRRQPQLQAASGARLATARLGHAVRILGRYALAAWTLLARRPQRGGLA